MAEIITDGSQKELKKHGSDEFPLLVSYEKLSGYKSGSFLWHWHPEIELTYIHKGEMLYKVNQNTFHLKEGQVLFGNANALHAGYMYHNQDCQYIPVTFEVSSSRNTQNRSCGVFLSLQFLWIFP